MKKMKKVLALLFALILAFSFTACGKKETAKDVMDASIKQMEKVKSYNMVSDVDMTLKTSSSSKSLDLKATSKGAVTDVNNKNMKLKLDTSTNLFGQKIEGSTYYADGYYYTDMLGNKTKMKMDLDAIKKQISSTMGKNNLSIDDYKDLKMKEDGDNRVISYSLSKEAVKKLTSAMLGQAMGSTSSLKDFDIDSIKGTATIDKDNYTVAQSVDMSLTFGSDKAKQSLEMTMSVKLSDFDKDLKITAPKDLDAYKETASTTTATTATK